MKVILLQDVKSLGKKDQIVEVSDGYARNMLLPKKLGMEATSKNLNDLKLKKAHEDKVGAEVLADAQALAAQIEKGQGNTRDNEVLSRFPSRWVKTEEPLVPFLPRKLQRQSSRNLDMTSTKRRLL